MILGTSLIPDITGGILEDDEKRITIQEMGCYEIVARF
jgi:hypothetical protein